MGSYTRRKYIFVASAISIIICLLIAFFLFNPKNMHNNKIRVACVGDSLTGGSNYPEYLWMLLGSDYEVGNFGVSATTVSFQSSKPYVEESEFSQAKNFQPNIIILMLGTNDAHPENQETKTKFIEDYKTIIMEFQKLDSKPEIMLVIPPPVLRNGTGISTAFYDHNIIPAIKEIASELNLQLIDLYTHLTDYPQYFSYDGVHPSESGSHAMAQLIYNAIVRNNK